MRVILLGVMVAVAAIMPASTMADDQQIADFIKARLMQEKQQGNLFGFNVDMRVDKGTVWFKGFVSNRSQELLILRTAQLAGHLGVVQVVDDIDVNNANARLNPLQPQAQAQMPQERMAMRPQQPYTSTYPMQNQGRLQQPVRMPQQSYPQPQTQRSPQRLPQASAPQAPRRMEIPVSATEPKKDLATQAVAYQEPVGRPRIPGPAMSSVISSPMQQVPAMQPSFQQNLLKPIPAQQTSAPMMMNSQPMSAPPAPIAAGTPLPFARAAAQGCNDCNGGAMMGGGGYYGDGTGIVSDNANLPGYAWPAYAAHPNYGAVSYPKQYSASAWPYIGPFYPYPQVPLGWRKVSLEWDDGWWFLDFSDK